MPRSICETPSDAGLASQLATLSADEPDGHASSSRHSSPEFVRHHSAGCRPGGRFLVRSVLTSAQGPRPKQEDRHIRVDDGWEEPKRSLSPSKVGPGRQPRARSPARRMQDKAEAGGSGPAVPSAAPGRPLLAFYGVFDGHGGCRASGLASRLLWKGVRERVTALAPDSWSPDELVAALHASFAETEAEILTQAAQNRWRDGSTAVCCLLLGETLCVANLGDSRAVLCAGGQSKGRKVSVERLSEDHKPELPSETARIVAAGGHVRCVQGIWRLNGELSLSRALGDAEFKPKPPRLKPGTPGSQAGGTSPSRASPQANRSPPRPGCSGGAGAACHRSPNASPWCTRPTALSAEPEVTVRTLSPDDHFLLLACDGLWDVLSDQEACRIVLDALRKQGSPQAACDKLVNSVLHSAKCTDNVSAVLVMLDYTPSEASDEAEQQGGT